MKVYVASHCRWAAEHIAEVLCEHGIVVISTWHTMPFHPTEHHAQNERQEIAEIDACEVISADALVLVAGPDKYSGGKFVEAGIAIGLGKPVVVIGRRENMLLWHRLVSSVDEPSHAAKALVASLEAQDD